MEGDKDSLLRDILSHHGLLRSDSLDLFVSQSSIRTLKKGDLVHSHGDIPKKVNFLLNGYLSVIELNDGDEIIKYFVSPNEFFVDVDALIKSQPSNEIIRCCTHSTIMSWQKDVFLDLDNNISNWSRIVQSIIAEGLSNKLRKLNELKNKKAVNSYSYLMREHPELMSSVSSTELSSYIGITKQSLSRIKKDYQNLPNGKK